MVRLFQNTFGDKRGDKSVIENIEPTVGLIQKY